MKNSKTSTFKMIKSEDLNHHGTLFAGRCSEWFVESSFIAASMALNPVNIVCLKIHGLEFLHPSRLGAILCFESQIVHAGRSSLTVYTKVFETKTAHLIHLDGFVTFCHIDSNGKSAPHGLILEPQTEEEKALFEKACQVLRLPAFKTPLATEQ
ncbi:MAG: acyl-CoA thioesterase [Bacteroidales bacterium]|jgi:acyl-CoA hydrolase|nr:acyl-CoA thioesterase [Bacteroidales bacterium]